MSTSGTVVYTVTEADIISDALEDLGVYGAGESVSSADTTKARRKLNLILKQMSAAQDYFSGEKFWLRKVGYLFLQKDTVEYTLGPSGSFCTSSMVRTTLTANAATSATALTVASITGISASDFLGIELDNGTLYWTTVSGSPSGSIVTANVGLTGAASAGNAVFAYTTYMRRPLDILTAVLRDSNSQDAPIDIRQTVGDYESIVNKAGVGDPQALYFSPTLTNSTVYLDAAPSDVSKVIRMVFRSPIEDMTTGTNNFDLPQEAFRYISAQLAIDCAPSFGKEISPTMKLIRDESLAILRNAQPQTTNLFFQPELE